MTPTTIDGAPLAASSQFFDLLAFVTDPQGYAEKLKALQDVTEEYKRFVALVAPASDILSLKESLASELATQKQATEFAKEAADKAVKDSHVYAEQIVADAKKQANEILTDAQEIETAAKKQKSDLFDALAAAKDARISSDAAATDYNARIKSLEADRASVIAALADAVLAKKDILEKHKVFIESLS